MLNILTVYRHLQFLKRTKVTKALIEGLGFFIYNCRIHLDTKIGEGTICAYGGIGVVIHRRAQIGANCMIGQNVTIGGRNGEYEVPEIGNNVFIGPNSVLLGPIKIGDGAVIGAGSIVLKDIKNNETWAGNPARRLK